MKLKALLSILFIFCFAFGNTLSAQNEIVADVNNSNLNNISGLLILELANAVNESSENESARYSPFELDENIYTVKASKSFGSYVVPKTNFLKIVSSDDKKYNRAQLINKETGKSLFSIRLLGSKNTVDMTGTEAGVYRLILTNSNNDIYTEDIMIM